ncbi:MAG TPA: stage II sporulation protein R [Candidatus Scatavimonas merdigallinarum]|uniref:Stage II sporulation protein R n=1 Tax=Candidatus Scatavimonas merdigallinarum TaxID=2840914 RepID=A0A9D0ZFN3_9FIRM|nr:stage II sporulation protein R [Candidatus Scatavimonas merdigallinarum]
MKLLIKSAAFGLALTILFSGLYFHAECKVISNSVLRLHILANSDSEEDQALKLRVRDAVLEEAGALFSSAHSKEDAAKLAKAGLSKIEEIAQACITEQGYNYTVRAELTSMFFQTRIYDHIAMPAGVYDALRITIGSGQGHNWWCVMYPPICLPAAEKKDELEDVLEKEQIDILENQPKYEIKFKIVEIFESIANFFTNGA